MGKCHASVSAFGCKVQMHVVCYANAPHTLVLSAALKTHAPPPPPFPLWEGRGIPPLPFQTWRCQCLAMSAHSCTETPPPPPPTPLADVMLWSQGGKNAKEQPAYGADVLRLWVASVDYNSDVLIGNRIISQVPHPSFGQTSSLLLTHTRFLI